MRPDPVTGHGPWNHARAGRVNDHLEELSKLSWFTATYPLVLDQTWCGWVLSMDPTPTFEGAASFGGNVTFTGAVTFLGSPVTVGDGTHSVTINMTKGSLVF